MTKSSDSTSPNSKGKTKSFKSLGQIVAAVADLFQPPERLSVSEAAEKYVELNNPGSYVGPYLNAEAPYMVKPMNEFTARDKSGLIFVGPAQCGKTQSLILNSIAYSVMVDPMDVIVFNPTQSAARDFSIRRIDRMHRDSEQIGAMLLGTRDADNVYDKQYVNGMMLNLSHPTASTLAGRPIPRVVITDRDRMDDNIDGEGEVYDLAAKRTTSFRSFAMCMAESSPSRPIKDPKWVRRSPHEAPPCGGILGLYNRGDRHRFYWPCPHCGEYFEGTFRNLTWEKKPNALAAAETVRMICPNDICGEAIHPDDRYDMMQRGEWVADGQAITSDGVIHGDRPRTAITSFWLNGVAAAFTNWPKLVQIFIDAEASYDRTGDEDALTKFYNNDLGEPYLPKSLEQQRLPEVLMSRAEDLGGTKEEPVVPYGVRFLVATVDVQQNMFKVQVQGILPGEPFDMVYVDRFDIRLSAGRLDADGQTAWVKPGTYVEDWDLITEQVIKKTYPLADGSGRRMMVKATGCDSGGKAGVTANAYEYYRKLRKERLNGRFQLVKGVSTPGAPRTSIHYPDSSQRDAKAAARGDVPVLMLQSNQIKDMLSGRLDSTIPGHGMVRYPEWLPEWFYAELCSEQRTEKGWIKQAHARNEAWDLSYYCIGICLSPSIQVEHLDWNNPRSWFANWDDNLLVVAPDQQDRFASSSRPRYDFAALARKLAS